MMGQGPSIPISAYCTLRNQKEARVCSQHTDFRSMGKEMHLPGTTTALTPSRRHKLASATPMNLLQFEIENTHLPNRPALSQCSRLSSPKPFPLVSPLIQ